MYPAVLSGAGTAGSAADKYLCHCLPWAPEQMQYLFGNIWLHLSAAPASSPGIIEKLQILHNFPLLAATASPNTSIVSPC